MEGGLTVFNSQIARTKIDPKTLNQLWGVAAGRCEMCNVLLYSDLTFGIPGNYAENAHICAVGKNGPRHKASMTQEEINTIGNLMLLCPTCHKYIDSNPDDFYKRLLINRKRGHEERVRAVTEIGADQTCRIVTYFVNVDGQKEVFDERLLKEALIKANRVPLQYSPIALHDSMDTIFSPIKAGFDEKANALCKNFWDMFGRIQDEESIAIFALAPQPLLVKLGTLINDQCNVQVFQCHREGHKWAWKDNENNTVFITKTTKDSGTKRVALVIDLSATITDDRITSVLGDDITVVHLTIDSPNRGFVTHPTIQKKFVKKFRQAMEDIKNRSSRPDVIHLFPAMPNSLAVRLGMDYMPKADLPIVLYEQATANEGFFETITIGGIKNEYATA
jgi:hypothetical protein